MGTGLLAGLMACSNLSVVWRLLRGSALLCMSMHLTQLLFPACCSVHKCCCRECAAMIGQQPNKQCPVCRQPIQHVIMNFF